MSIVLFSWLSAQLPFKQLTDTDIRKKIIEDNNSNVEEEILPFGFINNGSIDNESFIDSDGDVWEPVDKGFFPLSTGSYSWDDE